MSPIRVGVVGCGAIARECHIQSLLSVPGVEVVMLCDRIIANAGLARGEQGIPAKITSNVADFAGAVDAAVVAVPPRFHSPVSIQLLEMGIDVFCEKPLATSVADGEEMVAVAERNKRILSVGLMMRYYSNNEILRQLSRDPLLGEIREIVVEYGSSLGWAMVSDGYFNREATGGGVFFDSGVHFLDRVLYIFGDIHDLDYEDDSYGGFESNARLSGHFIIDGKRVPCRVAVSWTHALNNSIRIIGSAATADAFIKDSDQVIISRRGFEASYQMQLNSLTPSQNPFYAQIIDFVEAVRTRRQPFVTGASAVGALRVIERAYSCRRRIPQPWVETGGPKI